MSWRARLPGLAAALGGLLLVGEVSLRLGSFAEAPVSFDVGPSTGEYVTGFAPSEERPPVSFRWTGPRATIELPFLGTEQPARLRLRYARFLEGYARIRLFVSGQPVASWSARPGRFRTIEIPFRYPGGPLTIELVTEDPDPSGLGIPIDWVRVEGVRWTLPWNAVAPRLLLAGIFLLALFAGFGLGGAFAAGLAAVAVETAWLAHDPFAMAHVASRVVVPGLVLTGLTCLLARRSSQRRHARWLVLIFLTGYFLKGAGIFHPSYFYPDVRNHQRYVAAFVEAEGSLVERGITAQKIVRTAYPRRFAGKVYVFPYSPIFFVPFGWLPQNRQSIEDALKHVSLAAGAAEVLAVYAMAAWLAGAGPAVLASLLAAFLPPTYSRLFLAMWPTVAGHFLDMLAIVAATAMASDPARLRRSLVFAGLTFASFLTYISSLFNLGVFMACLAILERRLTLRVLLIGTSTAVATVGLLYFSFTESFFREILPALLSGSDTESSASLGARLVAAVRRLHLFFGYGYPAMALAGWLVARRDHRGPVHRTLMAFGVSFLVLTGMRVALGDLFKDLKEVLFVGPWVAAMAGIAVHRLAQQGRSGTWAAGFVTVGLVAFGCGKFAEYLAAYASLAGVD